MPVSWPDEFISLRHADADGQEHEIGLVRNLGDWPATEQSLLSQSLARRAFLRRILAIDSIELQFGLFTLRVETEQGPAQFAMRNSHS